MLESIFNKVTDIQAKNFIIKRIQHSCFLVNIAKFWRIPISKNICERLLLEGWSFSQVSNHFQKLKHRLQVVNHCHKELIIDVAEFLDLLLFAIDGILILKNVYTACLKCLSPHLELYTGIIWHNPSRRSAIHIYKLSQQSSVSGIYFQVS